MLSPTIYRLWQCTGLIYKDELICKRCIWIISISLCDVNLWDVRVHQLSIYDILYICEMYWTIYETHHGKSGADCVALDRPASASYPSGLDWQLHPQQWDHIVWISGRWSSRNWLNGYTGWSIARCSHMLWDPFFRITRQIWEMSDRTSRVRVLVWGSGIRACPFYCDNCPERVITLFFN